MSRNLILTDSFGEEICNLYFTTTEQTYRVLGQKDFEKQLEMYFRILINEMYTKNENCLWLINHIEKIKSTINKYPNCKFNWI